MSLSEDGDFHKSGFKKQADIVSKYIKSDTINILELGAGRSANTKYLAKKIPNIEFTAIDLPG